MFKNLKDKKSKVDAIKNPEYLSASIEVPDGMYDKCPKCEKTQLLEVIQNNRWVCPACDHHYRMHAASRVQMTFDSFRVFNHRVKSKDPLNFPGYASKLDDLNSKQGVYDAVVYGEATLGNHEVIAVIMDSNFLMGSMGTVVGEKVTRAFERGMQQKKPVIVFSASGGARMQEGMLSLMQMAKTSGAVGRFQDNGGLFINVLTDPTTGGVTASFAMLADIILAEPKALIGFAGPRVIEQTLKQPLPEGFQKSEFLLEKGFVDAIVSRHDMKQELVKILSIHGK